jgi:hypothetical protein
MKSRHWTLQYTPGCRRGLSIFKYIDVTVTATVILGLGIVRDRVRAKRGSTGGAVLVDTREVYNCCSHNWQTIGHRNGFLPTLTLTLTLTLVLFQHQQSSAKGLPPSLSGCAGASFAFTFTFTVGEIKLAWAWGSPWARSRSRHFILRLKINPPTNLERRLVRTLNLVQIYF